MGIEESLFKEIRVHTRASAARIFEVLMNDLEFFPLRCPR
jgi:hypothetical protein